MSPGGRLEGFCHLLVIYAPVSFVELMSLMVIKNVQKEVIPSLLWLECCRGEYNIPNGDVTSF
jgi:hypothetical protein